MSAVPVEAIRERQIPRSDGDYRWLEADTLMLGNEPSSFGRVERVHSHLLSLWAWV